MPGHDIICIGTSAGGVEALQTLVRGLPGNLKASLFIVIHLPAHGPSMLPEILNRATPLKAVHAKDGDEIKQGCIFVASPDHHLIVERGHVRVVRGPKENRYRPAVDPLFRSAARSYGPRVIAIVLTGALDDGTVGLQAVKRRSGIAVVQDPEDALYPSMPRSALRSVEVDHCVKLAAMPQLLARLVDEPATDEGAYPVPEEMEIEFKINEEGRSDMEDLQKIGKPSTFTCPECHGALYEMREDEVLRYRCHVGHAYTADSMLEGYNESVEATLWQALRALEEKAHLARKLGERARERHHSIAAAQFEKRANEAEKHAELLKELLAAGNSKGIEETAAPEKAAG